MSELWKKGFHKLILYLTKRNKDRTETWKQSSIFISTKLYMYNIWKNVLAPSLCFFTNNKLMKHRVWVITILHSLPLRLRDGMLKILESFLIIQKAHKPEIEAVLGIYLYVLLWRILHIFTLVYTLYLFKWNQDLQIRDRFRGLS